MVELCSEGRGDLQQEAECPSLQHSTERLKSNNVLNYELEAEAGVDMKHNYDKWASRIENLKNKG